MDFYKLQARYNEAEQYKERWLALYKDLYFYVIPDRDAMNVKFNFRDDGKPVTANVWDNTAVLASYQRANDLHGLLLPKDRVWGRLAMDSSKFKKEIIAQSKPLLDEINERIYSYINSSNLARIVNSSNLDLVGGTAAIWVESIDDDTPLYFRSIPSIALYIEYSTDDTLNTCWYQCKMTGRQVTDKFPKYVGSQKSVMMQNPNDLYTVVYGQIKMTETKFYIYAVLEQDMTTPLFEIERSYPQIIIYRDRVRPGEADGRGIGLDLLPMIMDLNKIVMYSRQNMAFKANPPLFVNSDSYFNPYAVRQWAGAIFMKKPNAANPVEALHMPEYPDVLEQVRDLREFIRVGFQVDPLGEINTPVRSATEVSIRENRAQRSSATDISRLINELPRQIYEISAKILHERGLLTHDRSMIKNFSTKRLSFDYQSPLYDLQKQDDLNHFTVYLQTQQQFFGEGAAMATLDLVESRAFLADKLNLPAKLFKSDDDLKQIITQMAKQASESQLPNPTTSGSQVSLPQQSQVLV